MDQVFGYGKRMEEELHFLSCILALLDTSNNKPGTGNDLLLGYFLFSEKVRDKLNVKFPICYD